MSEKEFVIRFLLDHQKTVATAESCTGGMLGAAFTDYAGISEVYMEGAVTYANAAKERLGVRHETLEAHGAVSRETAAEMAEAIRTRADTDFGLSTTGIAGPGGGTPEKPVGLVYVAAYLKGKCEVQEFRFRGGRDAVRQRAVAKALLLMLEMLKKPC